MASTTGRRVVVPLTNQSGGGVIAGDVVVIDTTHDDSFTTDTSGGFVGTVGIAQETIASGASGQVLLSGEAALVNVNASVTRGHFGKTYTVAKQATDAGASRGVGTFCQFKTGGTTPKAIIYPVDLLGSSLTNPMTTKGDIIIADTGGTPTRLAAGATSGMVLTSAGSGAFETFSLPPGYELAYVEFTTNVSITATTEGTANTIVSAGAVTFDGTAVIIECFSPQVNPSGSSSLTFILYDGAALGQLEVINTSAGIYKASLQRRKLTPSAGSHTYIWKAYTAAGTGTIFAASGGTGANVPGYIRITKA